MQVAHTVGVRRSGPLATRNDLWISVRCPQLPQSDQRRAPHLDDTAGMRVKLTLRSVAGERDIELDSLNGATVSELAPLLGSAVLAGAGTSLFSGGRPLSATAMLG